MFTQRTGSKQVAVRADYSDYATYGSGHYAFAATGNLDAPDYMAQGSVRVHNTIKLTPALSLSHREWEYGRPIGCGHDGPEAVPPTLYMHAD